MKHLMVYFKGVMSLYELHLEGEHQRNSATHRDMQANHSTQYATQTQFIASQ